MLDPSRVAAQVASRHRLHRRRADLRPPRRRARADDRGRRVGDGGDRARRRRRAARVLAIATTVAYFAGRASALPAARRAGSRAQRAPCARCRSPTSTAAACLRRRDRDPRATSPRGRRLRRSARRRRPRACSMLGLRRIVPAFAARRRLRRVHRRPGVHLDARRLEIGAGRVIRRSVRPSRRRSLCTSSSTASATDARPADRAVTLRLAVLARPGAWPLAMRAGSSRRVARAAATADRRPSDAGRDRADAGGHAAQRHGACARPRCRRGGRRTARARAGGSSTSSGSTRTATATCTSSSPTAAA